MDPRQVSTHGFMHNILHTCLVLCDPLLDSKFSKIGLVNDEFLCLSSRIDVSEDTRVLFDKAKADAHSLEKQKHSSNDSFNFVTEIFFMTLAYQHYGASSTIRHYMNMSKQLRKMKEQLLRLKSDQRNPMWQNPMFQNQFKNFCLSIDKMIIEKLSIEATMLDRHSIQHTLEFYNLVIVWLIKVAFLERLSGKMEWDLILKGQIG